MIEKRKGLWLWLLIGLIIFTPSSYIIFKNPKNFLGSLSVFQNYSWHGFINEANTIRGQVDRLGIPFLGKLTASNAETAFYKYLDTALTTLDIHFLFFEGDINPVRSTRNVGAVFLVFLPLAYMGIKSLNDKWRSWTLGTMVAWIFIAGFWESAYFLTPRIPIVIIIMVLGFRGWYQIVKKSPKIGMYISLILLWQFFSNVHYLVKHFG